MIWKEVDYLSKPFQKAVNELKAAVLGSEEEEVRWETCVSAVDNGIPFALIAMLVREIFNGETKPMAESMSDAIKEAYKKNLFQLKWIDPETRKLIIAKVDSLKVNIGFPDYILHSDQLDKEYEKLEFSETDYFNNNLKILQYNEIKSWKKLDLPPNREELKMSATDVNGYYSTSLNSYTINAAYLQPPFYDVNYPR
ncbi:endothelin-converting enzyme homolog [Nephila pilipes]|uniref:Endothelin-converting enzyme homolog n=1 Tax=Nephila pilipes TaxID=299642 RepID=A0A8X6PHX4_NEPPI|nr:endothelin-converting enzyme homolog [Nephila pilipes]